jgi:hypothetical protein
MSICRHILLIQHVINLAILMRQKITFEEDSPRLILNGTLIHNPQCETLFLTSSAGGDNICLDIETCSIIGQFKNLRKLIIRTEIEDLKFISTLGDHLTCLDITYIQYDNGRLSKV